MHLGCLLRVLWVHFGVGLGCVWGAFRVYFESVLDAFGVHFGGGFRVHWGVGVHFESGCILGCRVQCGVGLG